MSYAMDLYRILEHVGFCSAAFRWYTSNEKIIVQEWGELREIETNCIELIKEKRNFGFELMLLR